MKTEKLYRVSRLFRLRLGRDKRTKEIWALADDAYELAQQDGDDTKMAIWARALEKTRKLALLYACSENHMEPRITLAAMDWAWAVVEHQTRKMLYMASVYVADSDFEADCKKVIAVLTKWRERHNDEFMAHWLVSRSLGWAEKKIEEIRESLVAQELIEVQMPQRGRMRPQYRLQR